VGRFGIKHFSRLKIRSILLVVVALLFGCGEALPTLAPVSGRITQAGKPVAEAKVTLFPQGERLAGLPLPIAITDESGNFSITTVSGNDGALPGTYTVAVELRAPRRAGEEMVRDGRHLLPPRYADPATSRIVKEVTPELNQWEPIDLPAR
jgi:hypothetical protein